MEHRFAVGDRVCITETDNTGLGAHHMGQIGTIDALHTADEKGPLNGVQMDAGGHWLLWDWALKPASKDSL